jgi:tight adherence protein C
MDDIVTSENMIVIISAIIAALSFAAFALPFLNNSAKKERYQSIIEKKRRTLFEQTKQEVENRGKKSADTMSAKDSVATTFKMQEMLGSMGDKVRNQMLQAGIRNPNAPLKYILARAILPFVGVGFAMLFMSKSEDMSDAKQAIILLVSALAGYGLPRLIIKNMIQKRSQEINYTFPDALDMMLICVQGGIGLEQTVNRIADEISEHSPTLAEELGILSAEMAMLNDRRAALQDFARRVGSGAARSFATALIQAEQYGTSVSQAMRVMAEDLRDQRMATAEQKAAALPPKLTVPMILFFLPVLFVVILGPAIIQAQQTLG